MGCGLRLRVSLLVGEAERGVALLPRPWAGGTGRALTGGDNKA